MNKLRDHFMMAWASMFVYVWGEEKEMSEYSKKYRFWAR